MVWILLGTLGAIAALELILRWGLGLGRPVLYVADPAMGYRLKPNQRLRRLGRRIVINHYSMRGAAIAPDCPPQTTRILLLGDSVANGNWWTDQDQTLSALMSQQLHSLSDHLRLIPPANATPLTKGGRGDRETGQSIQVLNASANSWGPRNELAYVQQFGTFGATVVILLLNTDDLFATAPTSLQVGRDRNYPDRNPPFALVELYTYYLKKPQPIPGLKQVQQEGGDRVGKNLDAIAQLHSLCRTQNAELRIALTPLKREVAPGKPRDYEQVACQRLFDFTQERDIPYLDFLPQFDGGGDSASADLSVRLYRDHIHLSPAGNQLVSRALSQWLMFQKSSLTNPE